jgi:hypothetical protein
VDTDALTMTFHDRSGRDALVEQITLAAGHVLTVITTLPVFCPVSTYLVASATASRG